jgi:hypothetical protein
MFKLFVFPIGSRLFPTYKYVSTSTKPSVLLKVAVASLSTKFKEKLPRMSPLGLPSAATELYRSISIGKGIDPVTTALE